jgi:hypothetical protein
VPIAKPTVLPEWLSDANSAVPAICVEPSAGEKTDGWAVSARPPAQKFNWWKHHVWRWIRWLNDLTNQALTWAAPHSFEQGLNAQGAAGSGDYAIQAIGDGSGAGIYAEGGSSNGPGGQFLGNGTGAGILCVGGSNAPGLQVSAGGGVNPGVESYPTGLAPAFRCKSSGTAGSGGIHFDGSAPVPTANPGANIAHAPSIAKAWGVVQIVPGGGGSYVLTLMGGLNVQSLTVVGVDIFRINFAGNMADAYYAVTPEKNVWNESPVVGSKFMSNFNAMISLDGTGPIDLSTGPTRYFCFNVHARQ